MARRALVAALVLSGTLVPVAIDSGSLQAAPPTAGFNPIDGARLMDTRPGFHTVDEVDAGGGARAAGSIARLQVAGRAGVPAEASSAALNITVPEPTTSGFITLYPCGQLPPTSTVNYTAGDTVATSAIGQLDPAGFVCLYTSAQTEVVVDITGWFAQSSIVSTPPNRMLDTRSGFETSDGQFAGQGRRPADSTIRVPIAGRAAGVPSDAKAVTVTVTVTQTTAPGFVTAFGCGGRPLASTLNYLSGQTIANSAIVPLDAEGFLCVYTMAATDLIVDVTGYAPATSDFTALAPARLVDTRFDGATIDDRCEATNRPRGNTSMTVPILGRAGVPASGVGAVALNVTAIDSGADGFISIRSDPSKPPSTSAVNFSTGRTIANSLIAPVDASGSIDLFVNTGVHVLIDVVGWFPATLGFSDVGECGGWFVGPTSRLNTLAAAGSKTSEQCAIKTDLTLHCWGYLSTMLGPTIQAPRQVSGIVNAFQVTGGADGACVLRAEGSVMCVRMGVSSFGYALPLTAHAVELSARAIDISGSASLACAITTTPTLECWTGDTAPVIVSAVAAPLEFLGALSFDARTATRFDPGTPLNRLAVRTASGVADVTMSMVNGAPNYQVTTSTEARVGTPWTDVLASQPSPFDPAHDTCIIVVDRRSACGNAQLTVSAGDPGLTGSGDLIQRVGNVSLEANGLMTDTSPTQITDLLSPLRARVPDLLGIVPSPNGWPCGLVATGEVVCWRASVPYNEVPFVQLTDVAMAFPRWTHPRP